MVLVGMDTQQIWDAEKNVDNGEYAIRNFQRVSIQVP